MSIEDIKEIASLLNLGIPVVVAVIVSIICITHIDKLLLLLSSVQKLFSFCSRRARKGTIANSIRGKVMKASKSFCSVGKDVMMSDLKIEWVREETPESFIKNNQVIIRIAQNTNPHENYATAVTAFVGRGLLPKAKRYIASDIYLLSKLAVSRQLILNGDADALDYFDEKILTPVLSADSSAGETLKRLKAIDGNGMFVNILLNEYAKAAKKIYPSLPDPLFTAESSEFLTYLYRIAIRTIADIEEFKFNREYFKVHIFLTAKTATYKKCGLSPYLKHINDSLSQGIETVYVFGLGSKREIAREITETAKREDFRIYSIIQHPYRHRFFDGGTIGGVCYEIEVYKEE